RQAVGCFQSRPAVGAADELLRQAELEPGVLREIRERTDAERLCALLAHRERVAVVEAEPHGYAEALGAERAVQLLHSRMAFELEDFLGDRPGVLGVKIDRAGLQRGEDDARAPEPRFVLDRRDPL